MVNATGRSAILDYCESLMTEVQQSNDAGAICHALEELFAQYKLINVEFVRSTGLLFWRARLTDDRPYETVADLSYPPATVTRQNRLNDKGAPIMYAASLVETALQEINADRGDLVCIAAFAI